VDTYDRLRETGDVGSDMGILNLVAHGWGDRIVTGPSLCTPFKTYADNGVAAWMHK